MAVTGDVAPRQTTGQLIAERRTALGWYQQQFATRVGSTQPHVSHVENGAVPLTIDELVVWAEGLRVSPLDLVGDDDRTNERAIERERRRGRRPSATAKAPLSRALAESIAPADYERVAGLGISLRLVRDVAVGRKAFTATQAKALTAARLGKLPALEG